MNKILLFTILLFIVSHLLIAEDYSFDVSEFENKKFDMSGNLKINPIYLQNNRESDLFRAKYFNQMPEGYSDMFYVIPEFFLKFDNKKFKYNISGNLNLLLKDHEWDLDRTLYESYLEFQTGYITHGIGKKTVKWGKGYIWNPVSFAGKQKDVDDVDAALEGFYMYHLQWVKAINRGKIKNMAIDLVLIPSSADYNESFGNGASMSYLSRIYALVNNTDLDLYFLYNGDEDVKYGMDFSRNLRDNWEIHFEFSHENNYRQYFMDSTGKLASTLKSNNNLLLGTRYLTQNEITIIFEYIHNAGGLTSDQMDNYYTALKTALDTNLNVPYYKANSTFFNKQFISRDYLYLKMTRPQPWDLLYFTPGFYMIYNLTDNSSVSTAEVKYTGFTSYEILGKYSIFGGGDSTQYGEKASRKKIELQVRYFF